MASVLTMIMKKVGITTSDVILHGNLHNLTVSVHGDECILGQ